MVDVTSSLIGISINSINSWPAAAIRFPSCSGTGDRAMSSMPGLELSTKAQLVWVLFRVHLTENKGHFLSPALAFENHPSIFSGCPNGFVVCGCGGGGGYELEGDSGGTGAGNRRTGKVRCVCRRGQHNSLIPRLEPGHARTQPWDQHENTYSSHQLLGQSRALSQATGLFGAVTPAVLCTVDTRTNTQQLQA